MNPKKTPPPGDANEEISSLIEVLHETGQRLEELTAGEVDTVANRAGRVVLLRRAQDHLRHNEAAKQAAILNALPAHVALLDTQGLIISVNEAWRRFGSANAIQGPGYGIGLNYLEICDSARGDDAFEAHQAAKGIRSVLGGGVNSFSIEYPCHSPTEQRWFLMTVTPLADDRPNGVVVMHLDVTAERQTNESLRVSELRFREMAENIRDVFFLRDADGSRILYISPAYEEIWGRSCESLYANPESWSEAIHPDDRASTYEKYKKGMAAGKYEVEYRIVRPDGSIRWIETRGFPVRDDAGKIARTAGVAEDITERKLVEETARANENRLRVALSNINMAVFHQDRTLRYTWMYQPQLGYLPEQVIGHTDAELLPPEAARRVTELKQRVLETGEIVHDEVGVAVKDATFFYDLTAEPLRNASGAIIGLTGVTLDITARKQAEQTLRESEAELRAIFDGALDGILVADVEARKFLTGNPEICRMLGYRLEDIVRVGLLDIHPKQDLPHVMEQFERLRRDEIQLAADIPVMRKDGSVFYADIKASSIRLGGKDCLLGIFHDVTERKEAEDRIARLNRVYAMLSGINALIVRAPDRDELFRETCRIAVEAGAYRMAWIGVIDPQTLDGKLVAWHGDEQGYVEKIENIMLTARDGTPDSERLASRALRQSQPVICNDIATDPTILPRRDELVKRGLKSVGCFPLTVSGRPEAVIALFAGDPDVFDDEETRLLLELASNISFALDHIEESKKLNYLAYYDVLTGLANRSLFLDRATQYMRSAVSGGHKLALFLIDLERFKNINDSLGRRAGDALLRQVAEWLTRIAGDANLLARVDADHFAAVLPKVKQEGDLARFLEKTMDAFLDHPFRLNDAVFRIAFKAGVALFPDDGADTDTLFKNAEAALKKAKASGDRFLFYTQKMTEAVAGTLTLENQLRQALDKGEFVLYYQPKVNLVSGKLTSAEALIRWQDPRTGLVPPGRFIPILEETGLIHDVGRWALRKAIEDYLRWRAAGLAAVRIAVNVSPLQLRSRGFIAEIRQAIDIDPHGAAGLELEITENVIMADVKHSIASLQAIRAMGVSIAIDDFGTGFSSLSYLSKLPVDALKIDRSFVINMTAAPEGLALVSTIINLAHSLNLTVVAEGVETEEQARLLRLLRCDEMQGFLFSKPVPGEIFETRYLAPAFLSSEPVRTNHVHETIS